MLNISQTKSLSRAFLYGGLGILFLTSWWWPGIMFVLGLSKIIELIGYSKFKETGVVLTIFIVFPILLILFQEHNVDPVTLIGYGLIFTGCIYLAEAYFKKN